MLQINQRQIKINCFLVALSFCTGFCVYLCVCMCVCVRVMCVKASDMGETTDHALESIRPRHLAFSGSWSGENEL